jgi:hypothetical protein
MSEYVGLKRLELRKAADYRAVVPDLRNVVQESYKGNQKYWAPAKQTVPARDALSLGDLGRGARSYFAIPSCASTSKKCCSPHDGVRRWACRNRDAFVFGQREGQSSDMDRVAGSATFFSPTRRMALHDLQ